MIKDIYKQHLKHKELADEKEELIAREIDFICQESGFDVYLASEPFSRGDFVCFSIVYIFLDKQEDTDPRWMAMEDVEAGDLCVAMGENSFEVWIYNN